MPVDPQAQALRAMLTAMHVPPMHTQTVEEVRAPYDAMSQFMGT